MLFIFPYSWWLLSYTLPGISLCHSKRKYLSFFSRIIRPNRLVRWYIFMVLNGPCSPFFLLLAVRYGYLWICCSFNKSLYILRCAGIGMLVDWLHCLVGCWELTLTYNSANKAKQVSLILMTCASLQTLNSSFPFA